MVFRKKKNRSWRCRKGPERLLPVGKFGLRQMFSLSRQSFLILCRDMILYVATWFPGCRQLLGGDRGFPSRDKVVFLLFLCCDNVLFSVVTMSQ